MANAKTDSSERLVNLALVLASSAKPLSREAILENVAGYEGYSDASDTAFQRLLERDKEKLRDVGMAIEWVEGVDGGYQLDEKATFAGELDLNDEDLAVVRTAAAALAGDPGFPFGRDLRMALAKIALTTDEGRVASVGRFADEAPDEQGSMTETLAKASFDGKRVTFHYTKPGDEPRLREVEPYGVFMREGRWYLVGRDVDRGAERVFAVSRMSGLIANPVAPASRDFERPAGFSVAAYESLPFQIDRSGGGARFEARLRLAAVDAWHLRRLTAGRGTARELPDGAIEWTIDAADEAALATWVVEHGPGVTVVEPASVRTLVAEAMAEVVAQHG